MKIQFSDNTKSIKMTNTESLLKMIEDQQRQINELKNLILNKKVRMFGYSPFRENAS